MARKVARDRKEPNTTFNRWAGFVMNSENAKATKRCKAGSLEPHCSNSRDVFNPQDIATTRIQHDYGIKEKRQAKAPYSILSGGPLKTHSAAQFQGSGDKKRKKSYLHRKILLFYG